MKSLRILALVCPALLVACGGSSGGDSDDGTTSATGKFGTTSLEFNNALAADYDTGGKGTVLDVVLTKTTTCADSADAEPDANDQIAEIALYTVPDLTTKLFVAATTPGTYSLDVTSTGPFAGIDVVTFDANCQQVTTAGGEYDTGTVTVTSIAGSVVTGTINASDAAGDTLTGSFTSAACTAINSFGGSGSATCKQ